MARIADEEIERLKRGGGPGRAGGPVRGGAEEGRRRPGRVLPVPRRRHPVAGGHASEEPLALHGGVPDRWLGHRLGDADPGGELPPRRRGAAGRCGSGDHTGHGRGRWPRGPGRPSCPRRSTPRPRTRRCSAQVVDYYHATLVDSPEALAYLARRKIDDPEVIDPVPPGLCQPHPRLPAAGQTDQGGRTPSGAACSASVCCAPSGHEHLTGSLVVPVMSPDGTVTELYGRKVGQHLRAGTPGPPLPARSPPGGVERGGSRPVAR